MSSGSASTTGPAGHGDREGARQVFRDALGTVDLRHPFGHLPEHPPVVDLLEGLAVEEVAPDLADEEDHRGRILQGDMEAGAGIGGAGAAGHHADAGAARQLAVRFGHHGGAALLPADDRLDLATTVIERIEHGEIAFARHAEDAVGSVGRQAGHKGLGGRHGAVGFGHAEPRRRSGIFALLGVPRGERTLVSFGPGAQAQAAAADRSIPARVKTSLPAGAGRPKK
jgi:hypothetical protein